MNRKVRTFYQPFPHFFIILLPQICGTQKVASSFTKLSFDLKITVRKKQFDKIYCCFP